MTLEEMFESLALGVLHNSPAVELGTYQIMDMHRPRIINYINQGLTYLHTTFHLKESQVNIELKQGTSRYYLNKEHAITNDAQSLKYIIDSPVQPFEDDVVQILQVITDTGESLPMNDLNSYESVHTPEYNCILVGDATFKYKYLTVIYRAKHKKIPLDASLDSKLTINIPASLNDALQYYVASQVFGNMATKDEVSLSGVFHSKFEKLINEFRNEGVFYKNQLGTNIKPTLRGWI